MNRKEKQDKISEFIVLEGGYFKDEEIDFLYNFVTNFAQYEGRSKSINQLSTDYSFGQGCTKERKITYILRQDHNGINIVEICKCRGKFRKDVKVYNKAKDILHLLRWFNI